MATNTDFTYHQGGCYLNNSGRAKYLNFWAQRMEESIKIPLEQTQPRWDILTQQVKRYKQFVYQPTTLYTPYQIR